MSEMQSIWGWEPALYLFLGGLGAGTFVAAAVLFLVTGRRMKKTFAVASWTSLVFLGGGLLLLIMELEVPVRGLMMWQSFSHFTSWMTIGAWLVFSSLVVFGLTGLGATERIWKLVDGKVEVLAQRRSLLLKVLAICGIVLGLGVAVYTGLLLMTAPGVPLWNTPLLPCLFTVSALDTGVAALVVILAFTKEAKHDIGRRLESVVIVLVLIEVVVLAAFSFDMFLGNPLALNGVGVGDEVSLYAQAGAYAFSSGAVQSVSELFFGRFSLVFWVVFVVLGLAVPLIAAVCGIRSTSKSVASVGLIGAGCALVGGCALRFLVLGAGAHVDLIGAAVTALVR